jgi:hypothetical protein
MRSYLIIRGSLILNATKKGGAQTVPGPHF